MEEVQTQIVHGLGIAIGRGPLGPAAGFDHVLLQAGRTVFVKLGQIELRRRIAQIGGLAQQLHAGRIIGFDLVLGLIVQVRTIRRGGSGGGGIRVG